MHYLVRGRLRQETAVELGRLLRDGTIARQEPDGQEIADSMERAVVTATGDIEWSEVCYCDTPLRHERATVYDRFFDDLTTEPIEGYRSHAGRSLLDHLDRLAEPTRRPTPGLTS